MRNVACLQRQPTCTESIPPDLPNVCTLGPPAAAAAAADWEQYYSNNEVLQQLQYYSNNEAREDAQVCKIVFSELPFSP